jgi:hypothetical protein
MSFPGWRYADGGPGHGARPSKRAGSAIPGHLSTGTAATSLLGWLSRGFVRHRDPLPTVGGADQPRELIAERTRSA